MYISFYPLRVWKQKLCNAKKLCQFQSVFILSLKMKLTWRIMECTFHSLGVSERKFNFKCLKRIMSISICLYFIVKNEIKQSILLNEIDNTEKKVFMNRIKNKRKDCKCMRILNHSIQIVKHNVEVRIITRWCNNKFLCFVKFCFIVFCFFFLFSLC